MNLTNESLDNYMDDSDFINSYLRNSSVNKKKRQSLEQDINNICSLLHYPTQKDLNKTYYRGMRVNRKKLQVGITFFNKGFTSCTTDQQIALDFSDKCCLFIFTLPKKIKMYKIPNSEEDEIILQPNLRFTITQISKKTHDLKEAFENIFYVKISKNKSEVSDDIYIKD